MLDYPVLGQTERADGSMVPVLDIPMMSDERWQQLATEHAVELYTRETGKTPEIIEAAFTFQRAWIDANWEPI